MGACQCKNCFGRDDDRSTISDVGDTSRSDSTQGLTTQLFDAPKSKKASNATKTVDSLVLQTLHVIGKLGLSGYNQEPPNSLQKLNVIGDQEEGWLQIIFSLINNVPVEDPLGTAVIIVVLDGCPLPNKETVMKLTLRMNLSKYVSNKSRKSIRYHRNVCMILGVLAEKLPGPSSSVMLTPGTLEYLVTNLDCKKVDPVVTLFSLIALEKFAQITENKVVIRNYLENEQKNPLLKLENLIKSENIVEEQVGFCARWLLDNVFTQKNRSLSYLNTDTSKLNAMLNTKDTSEYLKLSPDGIEARCDAHSFESVRCTFQVNEGTWYYEAQVLTSGVMQIGWATNHSLFRNHEGYGIGDDEFSIAYDGCRQQLWYKAANEVLDGRAPWRPGDIVGCLICQPLEYVSFYLNGQMVVKTGRIFASAKVGFFAAASFMTFQQCKFNFGHKPFKYPPTDVQFTTFNEYGCLSDNERIVLPKHIQFKQIQNLSILEDSCTLCFDNKATVTLQPCQHSGFCEKCSNLLTKCPVCRTKLETQYDPFLDTYYDSDY